MSQGPPPARLHPPSLHPSVSQPNPPPPPLGHGLEATVTYTGGGGVKGQKKKFVYLNLTSNFGTL